MGAAVDELADLLEIVAGESANLVRISPAVPGVVRKLPGADKLLTPLESTGGDSG
jgi:hypothetical protein